MKLTVVRYKTKPDAAQENERLIKQVFQELQAKSPAGVRYIALRLDDETFIHFSTTEDGDSPIPKLEAFGSFQSAIRERCIEPPRSSAVTIVGSYRMLDET
jgi:radical SAM superfamily enzyme with C-terminal helix-hairpin-helix motif